MKLRFGAAVVVVASSMLLAACGSDAEEPAGLDSTTDSSAESPGSAEPTDDADESGGADGGGEPDPSEPSAPETFSQPFLQDESIVELRDEVPIEVPDDATDEERAVIEAYGRYEAVWEQVLWGVPIEDTDIEDVAAGERLQGVRDYAQESIERERVTIGPPVSIHLLSVEVDGDSATVDVCLDTRDQVDSSSDAPPDPGDPLYRFTGELERTESWVVTRAGLVDDLSPCEGVFS